MKRKIGFDFDKVFVNYPPLIPDFLVNYLYKKSGKKLKYRYPGKIEIIIRKASHLNLFRRPITNNIKALERIYKTPNTATYLISSRFSFLKNRTEKWFLQNSIKPYFAGIYFNFSDKQPHIFKDNVIKKEKITDYIDDDLDLLKYLSEKNPKVKFYWLSSIRNEDMPSNISQIKDIKEFINKHLL